MAQRPDQRARQRGLAGPQVAFQINDQPRLQQWRQPFPQLLGGGFVGQFENGGNIGAMHDQDSTVDYAALKEKIRAAGQQLGFAAIGVARADPGDAVAGLRAWLADPGARSEALPPALQSRWVDAAVLPSRAKRLCVTL